MTPQDFIAKWKQVELTERSAAQQHFLDLCELFEHPKPAEADPTGEWFTFEKGAAKHGGDWADVWIAMEQHRAAQYHTANNSGLVFNGSNRSTKTFLAHEPGSEQGYKPGICGSSNSSWHGIAISAASKRLALATRRCAEEVENNCIRQRVFLASSCQMSESNNARDKQEILDCQIRVQQETRPSDKQETASIGMACPGGVGMRNRPA